MATTKSPKNDLPSTAKLSVACVITLTSVAGGKLEYNVANAVSARKSAFEDLQKICNELKLELIHIPFEKLDFGEGATLDTFYNADVAVVDTSIDTQQSALMYHVGVRESSGMSESILVMHQPKFQAASSVKNSCGNAG